MSGIAGRPRLCLREDGTYTFQIPCCLGPGPKDEGVWIQENDHITFDDGANERSMIDCCALVEVDGRVAVHQRSWKGNCYTLELVETAEEERARGGAGCAVPESQ